MHIIIGKENVDNLNLTEKFTVLELDTFKLAHDGTTVTAYCVVENIPINDLPKVESMRELHANLLENYRKKDWNYCNQALDFLIGFWGHELDTYYQSLRDRITQYTSADPGDNWDWTITKQSPAQITPV
jgi:hypothetical protein